MGKARRRRANGACARRAHAHQATDDGVLLAGMAASAAEWLASTALEDMLYASACVPETVLALDRLLTFIGSVVRVTASLAAGEAIDAANWDMVITALAWMHNRCW